MIIAKHIPALQILIFFLFMAGLLKGIFFFDFFFVAISRSFFLHLGSLCTFMNFTLASATRLMPIPP